MKISIITVCFNAGDRLKSTIESVIHQKYSSFEYIVIDGGSTDTSMEIIKKYESRISLWISEPDAGIYDAMNKGIKLATGEYILMMNAGDIFYDENVLGNVMPFLNGEDVVSGKALMSNQIWLPAKEEELSLAFFITRSLNHQATFMKRSMFLEDSYNLKYRISSDSLFFCKKLIFENATYLAIDVFIAKCEDSGASSCAKESYEEMSNGIKEMLPLRMSHDVDFIHLYHNEGVIKFGRLLRNIPFLKEIVHFYRRNKRIR